MVKLIIRIVRKIKTDASIHEIMQLLQLARCLFNRQLACASSLTLPFSFQYIFSYSLFIIQIKGRTINVALYLMYVKKDNIKIK